MQSEKKKGNSGLQMQEEHDLTFPDTGKDKPKPQPFCLPQARPAQCLYPPFPTIKAFAPSKLKACNSGFSPIHPTNSTQQLPVSAVTSSEESYLVAAFDGS